MRARSQLEDGLLISGGGIKEITPSLLRAALASVGISNSVELRPVRAVVGELICDTPIEFDDPRYVAYVDFTAYLRDNPEIMDKLGADKRGGFDNDVWQTVNGLFTIMEQDSFVLQSDGKITDRFSMNTDLMTHEFMTRQNGSIREKARKVPRDYFVAHGTHNILDVFSFNLYTLEELLEWIDRQELKNLLDPEDDRPEVRRQAVEFLKEYIPAKIEEARSKSLPPL